MEILVMLEEVFFMDKNHSYTGRKIYWPMMEQGEIFNSNWK
jgi:hypothetical protein